MLAGLVLGDRPGPAALLGIAVSFVAIALITRERTGDAPVPTCAVAALLPALAGGAIFGLFFVLLHQTGDHAGLWPLLAARLTSVPILAALVAWRREPLGLRAAGTVGAVAVSGSLDMAANILYLLASQHGMLAVVAALTGLYPASTIVLAQTRLSERMAPVQLAGPRVAALAAVMVAA
ncbi:MAG: hypothetical protein R2746_07585 [Acidimicrobiales bacterium]